MADITIVNGVYKPTYNWGAPSCSGDSIRQGTVPSSKLRVLLVRTREGGICQHHPQAHGEAGHESDDTEAERLRIGCY